MQIVIPAAGRGRRFLETGCLEPKPLIKVLGKPLIQWSTDGLKSIDNTRFIFLVLKEHIDNHQIDQELRKLYGNCDIISVEGVTEGAACTVLLAKEKLDLEDDMAIVNCDNLFSIDLERAKASLKKDEHGMIFYFASNYERWSYVQTDEFGFAKRITEKEVISDKATVGCYYFSKAKYFVEAAEHIIKNDIRVKGEFYVAPTYNILIDWGYKIRTFPCDFHFSLGTPEEVEQFTKLFSANANNYMQRDTHGQSPWPYKT